MYICMCIHTYMLTYLAYVHKSMHSYITIAAYTFMNAHSKLYTHSYIAIHNAYIRHAVVW